MENDDDILRDNQNLEDGELWLPSDIFSADEPNDVINRTKPSSINRRASSSIFGPFPGMHQGFKSAFSYNGPTGSLNSNSWTEWSPGFSSQQVNPVRRQVEGPVLNRFVPTRSICGGSSRGGTGVFLPKITSYDIGRHGQDKMPARNARSCKKNAK